MRAPRPNQQSRIPPQPRHRRALAAGVAIILLIAAGTLRGNAQQAGPTFEDLASQAAAARDQQNLPRAVDLYTRAVQLKPDWQEGWWYLTLLQYSANQYSGAIDAANHLLALEPHAVPAMALRGLSEFELADYQDSLRDLKTAVDHGAANDPYNEQIIRYHLALDLARAGRFEDALDQYKVFAEKGLTNPDLLTGLGLAGMHVTSFPSEVRDAERSLYEAAGDAGYSFLAGDPQKADALFQQLFATYPTASGLHLFYGTLLFQHDPLLASDQFRDELAVAPKSDSTRVLLAYALVIAGHYQEALPAAQQAYAADPDQQIAQIALGRALGETGDLKGGIQMLEKVVQGDPTDLEAHIGLAALYGRAGRREDAYRERMLCLKLAP